MAAALSMPVACQAAGYRLGQGLQTGDFLLSGYGNFVAEAPHTQVDKLTVDDLSLFVNGAIDRWLNPFIEAELSSATVLQEGGKRGHSGRLVLERAYDDLNLTRTDTLRLGKMLSPVGDWNLIHAAPLVPTIVRPLTTFRGFAQYSSGLSWLHESDLAAVPNWQVYWQPGRPLAKRSDSVYARHYEQVLGAHISWNFGFADDVGISFQRGKDLGSGQRFDLLGLNGRKTLGRFALQSEAIASYWKNEPVGGRRHEWGGFLLADYRFTSHWHGIVEREVFQPHGTDPQSRSNLVGIAYKPIPAAVWKLEYVHQQGRSSEIPTGWSASCAVLF